MLFLFFLVSVLFCLIIHPCERIDRLSEVKVNSFLYSLLQLQVLVEKMGHPDGSKDVRSASSSTLLRKLILFIDRIICGEIYQGKLF